MPVHMGPTKYLPHSQKYSHGYLAFRLPEFINYFEENYTQLPLNKGDAVFFNPAVLHAAGSNAKDSGLDRIGNLLQISSSMGRCMESVDRTHIVKAIYSTLSSLNVSQDSSREGLSQTSIDNVLKASTEGYAFPTNLDRDPPIGGLAPPTEFSLVISLSPSLSNNPPNNPSSTSWIYAVHLLIFRCDRRCRRAGLRRRLSPLLKNEHGADDLIRLWVSIYYPSDCNILHMIDLMSYIILSIYIYIYIYTYAQDQKIDNSIGLLFKVMKRVRRMTSQWQGSAYYS